MSLKEPAVMQMDKIEVENIEEEIKELEEELEEVKEKIEALEGEEGQERYREFIDEVNEPLKIGNISFTPSRVLEELDPIAFNCGFSEWSDEELSELENRKDEIKEEIQELNEKADKIMTSKEVNCAINGVD